MKKLIILGTGVHACEMVEIVERVNNVKKRFKLIGFLAEGEENVGEKLNGYPVLGSRGKINDYPDAVFVPDNNEWAWKLLMPGDRFISLIDPSVFVSQTSVIGVGCVFYPHCFIGLRAKVGDFVFSLSNTVISHDNVLENNVIIASGVRLAGSVHVESGCYLGQDCTCRGSIRIGKGSLIGMGTVVLKDVEPNSVMVGNPARKLRERKTCELRRGRR